MPSIRPIAPTLLLALALAGGVARAQTTAPAAPTVTPAPNCEKPADAPGTGSSEIGKSAAEQRRTKWQTGMKTYMECLKQFVEEQQAASSIARQSRERRRRGVQQGDQDLQRRDTGGAAVA